MATVIDSTTASSAAALQRPLQSPADPATGSDNRAIGNNRDDQRQAEQAAQQRSDEAFRLDIRSQRSDESRSQETQADESRESANAPASQPQQQQARPPAQDERETSSLQVNFSANGSVNTAANPNRAGQFVSLSV